MHLAKFKIDAIVIDTIVSIIVRCRNCTIYSSGFNLARYIWHVLFSSESLDIKTVNFVCR